MLHSIIKSIQKVFFILMINYHKSYKIKNNINHGQVVLLKFELDKYKLLHLETYLYF